MEDEKTQKSGSDEAQSNGNENKVILIMDTKLGQSKREFDVNDLKIMKYFENRLSGRWNIGEMISISSKEICFSTFELETLIFYKINNEIPSNYPVERLAYFCNALDYFTESIEPQLLKSYIDQYTPAIQIRDTVACTALGSIIENYLKQFNEKGREFIKAVVANWSNVPSTSLICCSSVAASVFVNNFKWVVIKQYTKNEQNSWDDYYDRRYNNWGVSFLKYRCVDDLCALWKYIMDNKLWKYYPKIVTSIYSMKSAELDHGDAVEKIPNAATMMTDILIETIGIACSEDNIPMNNKQCVETMNNFWDIITKMQSEEECCRYRFVMGVLDKLLKHKQLCSNGISAKLLDLLCQHFDGISKEQQKRNHDFAVKIKSINQRLNVKLSRLRDLFRPLIEVDVVEAVKKTQYWFPYCMKDSDFITQELPKQLTTNTIQPLVKGIWSYMVSTQNRKTPCPSLYVDFVTKYMSF